MARRNNLAEIGEEYVPLANTIGEHPAIDSKDAKLPAVVDDEVNGKAIVGSKGKFRFQKQLAHFVYKFHLDKVEMKDFFTTLNKGHELKEFHIAHENGDDNHPYPHTHILVNFGRIRDFKCARFADVDSSDEDDAINVHPHIHAVKNAAHWVTLIRYLAKEDPDNAEFKDFGLKETSIFDKVCAADSLAQALRMAKKPSDAPGIIAMWNSRQQEIPKADSDNILIEWQEDCFSRISGPGNPRYINWYWDAAGATGKSLLCKHILSKLPKEALCIKGSDLGGKDYAHLIKTACDNGNSLRVILFDLPRASESRSGDFYSTLEACCDGFITSGKYASSSVSWKPQHIIVFANFAPNRAKLSGDRWRVHKLTWASGNPETAWSAYAEAVEKAPVPPGAEGVADATPSAGGTGRFPSQEQKETLALQRPNIRHEMIAPAGRSSHGASAKKAGVSPSAKSVPDKAPAVSDSDIEVWLDGLL